MITFNQIGLKDELVQAVESLGFTNPTPIQQNTIPLLINETTDIIALAQTGTGKTAAFGLPLLHRLDEEERDVQALILAPTRELCMQITEDMAKYCQFLKNVSVVAVYGGASITDQIRNLRKGAQIVVATPGRLIDLINRRAIRLESVSTIVLDEADEMLNMGFREDIETIFEATQERESAWLFSATMNNDVRRMAKRFMKDPKEIAVAKENIGNENIVHQYFVVQGRHRYEALQRLLDLTHEIYGIIFTRTKQDAHDVSERLVKDGYAVSALHGDLDQNMRSKVMKRFKDKQIQIIVATDVAARGIDVNDITHVINYELPDDHEVYTHRSGRTARAGKKGICMSLVTSKDISKIRRIEKMVNSKFEKLEVPAGSEVIEGRLIGFLEKIENSSPDTTFESRYGKLVHDKLGHLNSEELINKLLWMQLSTTIENYSKAPDLNASFKEASRASTNDGSVRLFVNIGKKDGLSNKGLADFIADSIDFEYKLIDRVTVTDLSSYFNVPANAVEYIKDNLTQQKFNGRSIRVDEALERPDRGRSGGGDRGGNRSERRGGGDRNDSRNDRSGGGRGRERRSEGNFDRGIDRKRSDTGGGYGKRDDFKKSRTNDAPKRDRKSEGGESKDRTRKFFAD